MPGTGCLMDVRSESGRGGGSVEAGDPNGGADADADVDGEASVRCARTDCPFESIFKHRDL